jgi:hypothetical protein
MLASMRILLLGFLDKGDVSNDAARRGALWLRTWAARRGSLAFRPRASSEQKGLCRPRH